LSGGQQGHRSQAYQRGDQAAKTCPGGGEEEHNSQQRRREEGFQAPEPDQPQLAEATHRAEKEAAEDRAQERRAQ
jgi:hypothetical protein